MDDYCFRKIKSTALVMIAVVAVHIALSFPSGYYWNALQARLSNLDFTAADTASSGMSTQGLAIYALLFGVIALLAFVTSPRRTSIWWRLMLIVPMTIFFYSAYLEYDKISPIREKFKDIYDSIDIAVFVPLAAVAAVTTLYILLVIALPQFRVTQGFGWLTAIIAILSFLGKAVYIVYTYGMTIFEGTFGSGDFYTYLVMFALDVVSYFLMISVLMTYCTIKREERWDRLEAIALRMEKEADEDGFLYEETENRAISAESAPARLRGRVIPDAEDLKEHEVFDTAEIEAYMSLAERLASEERIALKKRIAEELRREEKSVRRKALRVEEDIAREKKIAREKEIARKRELTREPEEEKSKADLEKEAVPEKDIAREKAIKPEEEAPDGETSGEDNDIKWENVEAAEKDESAPESSGEITEKLAEDEPETSEEVVEEEKSAEPDEELPPEDSARSFSRRSEDGRPVRADRSRRNSDRGRKRKGGASRSGSRRKN